MSAEFTAPRCRKCSGSGVGRYGGLRPIDCMYCAGTGLGKQPKFRAECECGKRSPRLVSAYSVEKWMREHGRTHRPNPQEPA